MRDEMEIGKSDKYLFFETKDNDGEGNCFYTSILNSNAFSPAATIDDDVDTLLAMREELQQFAIENEQLIGKWIAGSIRSGRGSYWYCRSKTPKR
jgi:hypothetical protein